MTETNLPEIVSREQWLVARKELLVSEKEAVRAKDALNTRRRMLPMVQVDKDYRFEGPDGPATLADLFDGQRQLVVQHFMFHPEWEDGCSSCTAAVDELSDGLLRHLRARGTTYAVIARAPLAKLEKYRAKRGWTIPFYSSFGSDFNYDFHVTLDESVMPVEFNFRGADELREAGLGWTLDTANQPMEQPGMSCFLRVGDDVFHTYSTFARGSEQAGDSYGILDMTALGRQEEWEIPKGRSGSDRGPIPDFS
ncbi:DUF899 domain-containing protein [Actinoplanes sp. NPDC026619]|uniref:DUF899 domain-containing protein n=1 Tax=Actinoplanes sp. NPDC026619 TaxID=3155798 RepID=UPI003402D30C